MDIKMKPIHADLHIVMFTLSLPPPCCSSASPLKQPVFHKHHLMRKCVCHKIDNGYEVTMSEGFMLNGISNEHVNFHLHTIIYLCPHRCSSPMLLFVCIKELLSSHFIFKRASERKKGMKNHTLKIC